MTSFSSSPSPTFTSFWSSLQDSTLQLLWMISSSRLIWRSIVFVALPIFSLSTLRWATRTSSITALPLTRNKKLNDYPLLSLSVQDPQQQHQPSYADSNEPARSLEEDQQPFFQPTQTSPKEEETESNKKRLSFDYNQRVEKTRWTLPDPTVRHYNPMDQHHHHLVVFVLSGREHWEQRKTIRETWGLNHSLVFVVGGPAEHFLHETTSSSDNNTNTTGNNQTFSVEQLSFSSTHELAVQNRLEEEQRVHRDILDAIHPDSYASLPHKVKYAYRWITQNVPTVTWLAKVDDDTVVRVESLQRMLLDWLNPAMPLVLGCIVEDSPVQTEGRWAELPQYNKTLYPYWPRGACGHVVSRPVADFVAEYGDRLFVYQGEDTSLGIWLDEDYGKQNVSKTTSSLEQDDNNKSTRPSSIQLPPVTWLHSDYFTFDGKCDQANKWLVMGHQITPDSMRACYAIQDEWDEVEVHDNKKHRLVTLQTRKQQQDLAPAWW